MIVEAQGGITPHALAHIGYLTRRTKGATGRDSTKYGRSRTSTRSFFVHHCQRLGMAAKVHQVRAMLKSLAGYKHLAIAGHAGDGCRAGPATGAA